MKYLNSESKIWHWYFHSFLGSLSSEVSMCHTLIVLRALLAWFIGLHLVSTRVARTLPVYQYTSTNFIPISIPCFYLPHTSQNSVFNPIPRPDRYESFLKKPNIVPAWYEKKAPNLRPSWYAQKLVPEHVSPPPYWPQAPKNHDFPSDEMVHHLRILQKYCSWEQFLLATLVTIQGV
jgi:hypothetical protein